MILESTRSLTGLRGGGNNEKVVATREKCPPTQACAGRLTFVCNRLGVTFYKDTSE